MIAENRKPYFEMIPCEEMPNLFVDENNQVHYVEVKASTDAEYVFSISKPEVNFGEEHRLNYEVIFALNVTDQNRKLKNLVKIFDYDEDESFNNNSKFRVENDGFRIRFA